MLPLEVDRLTPIPLDVDILTPITVVETNKQIKLTSGIVHHIRGMNYRTYNRPI
jgi:hypothetical protein